jgi:alpha-amylase/alpha-mannosidase (GH57 family)
LAETTNRFLCVHAHFYQPPRENPWLEAVEAERSAAPYHDWNERVTDECYAVNLAARILDGSNQIVSIVNNYSRLSFNFGPTLQTWLEANHPEVYTAILDSDRENAPDYSGHGSAIAQGYNHLIMPLANRRDKETQVIWGISDFRRRFGRLPEGMWLPEAAVDLETLDIMSSQGIKFTVLAPHQSNRIRNPGEPWRSAGRSIDTSQPYICHLPSGRSIAIFFYNNDLSRGVAFQDLLNNGDTLADRIIGAFGNNSGPSLVTIATDGETYGHHRRFGEMALAYAFDKLSGLGVRITNMAEYLEMYPPSMEVEIIENSAWSCDHGVERWRSGCCCSTGFHPGWNQEWRAPLRKAMDLLRDNLSPLFEKQAGLLFTDPWAARNAYQNVIADRSPENVDAFFKQTALKPLSGTEKSLSLKLMELQRHLMAVYTSCGWFFDDIGGLESILVMKQAGRVLQLAKQIFGESPEKEFLAILDTAQSNDRSMGTGWDIFDREVRPLISDLGQAAANFAMNSLFKESPAESNLYTFTVKVNDLKKFGTGHLRFSSGDIEISSTVTLEKAHYVFAALLWGDHNLSTGLGRFQSLDDYLKLQKDLKAIADRADCAGCLRFLENKFPGMGFDLHSLFGDERTVIVDDIISSALSEAEAAHREIYSRQRDTMRFLFSLGQEAPPQFTSSAAFVLNMDLRKALQADPPDPEGMENLLTEMKMWDIPPDKETLSYYLSGQLENLLLKLIDNPDETGVIDRAVGLLQLFKGILLFPNLWRVQNLYFALFQNAYIGRRDQPGYSSWSESFRELGTLLSIKVN